MAKLVVKALTRVFAYNGLELADIDAAASPSKVKDFYAGMYPELSTAEIEGPETKGDKIIYKFKRSVGTKGAAAVQGLEANRVPFAQRLAAIASGQPDPWAEQNLQRVSPDQHQLSAISAFRLALTCTGTPVVLPSSAIALML